MLGCYRVRKKGRGHMPTQQRVERWRSAAIRHEGDIDTGRPLEHLEPNLSYRGRAGTRQCEVARPDARRIKQLRERVVRRFTVDDNDSRLTGEVANRLEAYQWIVVHLPHVRIDKKGICCNQ